MYKGTPSQFSMMVFIKMEQISSVPVRQGNSMLTSMHISGVEALNMQSKPE